MKFDYIIGNPPYQDETLGDNKGFAPPIYHKFLDSCYEISDHVEMIHPARFLSNAGSTPKEWNKKMLSDSHLKVLYFEAESAKVFPNTDIKGGVVVTYRDIEHDYGSIEVFTPYELLDSIRKKVQNKNFESMSNIVVSRTINRLTDKMHELYPEAESQLSKGHKYDVSTNIFTRLPQIFFSEKPDDQYDYLKILGRENNKRVFKYVREDFISNKANLNYYKIFIPKAHGSGKLGEFGTAILESPKVISTETFLSIGYFKTIKEAENALKYIKTKFARALLSLLKITQDITPEKWKYVPHQDFTDSSDIDWSKSISKIDQQLYQKYDLSPEEINFIETHIKETD